MPADAYKCRLQSYAPDTEIISSYADRTAHQSTSHRGRAHPAWPLIQPEPDPRSMLIRPEFGDDVLMDKKLHLTLTGQFRPYVGCRGRWREQQAHEMGIRNSWDRKPGLVISPSPTNG